MSHRTIFIGSSHEATDLADAVRQEIDAIEGCTAILWNDLFPAGIILLEQIERLPDSIAGAVLVATPDVTCERQGSTFASPVANILFEYGYLSGRLGRNRVAILQIDDSDLPSDLQGVRVIRDRQDRYRSREDFSLLRETKIDLARWIGQLPNLTPGIPAIAQVHGYSGTWDVRNRFTRWRDHALADADDVHFIGKTFLVMEPDGRSGGGVQVGTLHIAVGGYRAVREVVNEIVSATVDANGTLHLRLKMLRSRIVPGTESGAEQADARFHADLGRVVFPLELRATPAERATLRGPHAFERAADVQLQEASEKFVRVGLIGGADLEA